MYLFILKFIKTEKKIINFLLSLIGNDLIILDEPMINFKPEVRNKFL